MEINNVVILYLDNLKIKLVFKGDFKFQKFSRHLSSGKNIINKQEVPGVGKILKL